MSKKRRIPKTLFPHKLEQGYANEIIKMIDRVAEVVEWEFEEIAAQIDELNIINDAEGDDPLNEAVNEAIQNIRILSLGAMSEKDAEKAAKKHTRAVNAFEKNNFESQLKVKGVNPLADEEWLNAYTTAKVAENVSYISNIRDEYAKKVEQIIYRGVSEGKSSAAMRDELMKQTGMSRNKARFIARDQTGSVVGQMNAKRHQHAGIQAFRWRDSDDAAVRDSHRERDGKVYFYADNPLLPGEDYNCRCVAEPVFDDELADLGLLDPTPEPTGSASSFSGTEVMSKTNMKKQIGEQNYQDFTEHLSNIEDERVKELFEKYSDQVTFEKMKNGRAFARGSSVQLSPDNFAGGETKMPLQTVYHELGHAFDSVGMKVLTGKEKVPTGKVIKKKVLRRTVEVEETVSHASGLPEYKLRETINRDLWEYVNGKFLPTMEDLGPKPRKKAEKAEWEEKRSEIYRTSRKNFESFEKRMIETYGKRNTKIGALSDIYESTPYSEQSFPFGSGHGKDYYKTAGQVETEFFAHVMEGITTNPESFELLSEIFPNAIKTWENIVDDMTKAGE